MDFMTIKEAANRWGVSTRAVTYQVVAGRIAGAVKRGNLWLIPQDASKPFDGRRKRDSEQSVKPQDDSAPADGETPFPSLHEDKGMFAEMFRCFPYPMHVCAPDGTFLWANDEFLRFSQISHPERLYQRHNVLLAPEMERWGLKDFLLRAYRGEAVRAYDIKVPYQEIIEKYGDDKEIPSESVFQNITAFPIRDDKGKLLYIVTVFVTSRQYQGREEIMAGKEYIEAHWKEEFNIDRLADAIHISRYHYTRLFKQHTGMTPYNYYQEIKIQKLKEKLCDGNLSVAQAFAACGADFSGSFAKIFKEKVGMPPSQYQSMMCAK
ncbi:helix-turn-helix domain-containing protein [Ethanoligenens sp.]|uniref:helix-turn-helix domain-containing protein n=1 Tax=Ethanoligenens sp. TaxID=2099655 RepID=UPI0039ED4BD8